MSPVLSFELRGPAARRPSSPGIGARSVLAALRAGWPASARAVRR
jgi:hypothetical protein